MEEFAIENYKYGLDTRKDVLTAQPGTLQVCENAQVNPGGELEKRKAFVLFGDLAILDSDGFQGTFGIEITEVGLVTFGSALAFGVSPTQGQPNLVSAMPANITYQQLKHPVVGNYGESYDVSKHRMTQVLCSNNFNGKAFVIAKFNDGNTFVYYDGACIRQSFNGLVLDFQAMQTDLEGELEEVGWRAVPGVDENGNVQVDSVEVYSPANEYFTPLASWDSTNGFIGVKEIGIDGTGTAGTKAVAGFKITADSGTYQLAAPAQALTATPTFDLCGGTVASTGVIATTVAAIAQAVNDFTTYHGYSALATADTVFVYAPASFGNFTFNLTLTYTTATIVAAVGAPTALSGVISPSPLNVVLNLTRNKAATVKGDVQIDASGGTPGYTFLWSPAVFGSDNGIAIKQFSAATDAKNVTASFSKTGMDPNTTIKGDFKCVITDAVAATVTVFLTVSLTTVYKSGQ